MRRYRPMRLVLALFVASALASEDEKLDFSFMVPMRDGVRLATTVRRPAGDGPWPAVLVRTPYGWHSKKLHERTKEFTDHGYVAVIQNLRGRFDSEGEDYPVFVSDGWGKMQDGYDTVEWIASQPWCNGKVATVGSSAMGITQNMMAPSRPPHLVCQRVGVAMSSMYHEAAYQGGVFRQALIEGWLEKNHFDRRNIKTIRAHQLYDDFWRRLDARSVADQVQVPVMYLGGWYDIFSQGTIESYLAVNGRGSGRARGNCRLVMGPFGHGYSPDWDFPNRGAPPSAATLRWLNLWLKKDGKGIKRIPPVQYYVLGDPDAKNEPGCEWRTAQSWPIPATRTPFYLHKNGSLSRVSPKIRAGFRSVHYEPRNPVPTFGGANLNILKGPRDQRPVENRPDVLLFTSSRLTAPLEVTGRIYVKLWVSSSTLDTDFTAKLTDVFPDGRSMLVLDGIRRMSHRRSFTRREPIEPGEIYELEIDLWSVSIVFNTGHRVRLIVSSSNAPRFEPNLNIGPPWDARGRAIPARNTVYLDASHPSHLLLPLPQG